ncbi:MAG: Smr/MutS family protein, partial [Deltaproteobacteria bacterium]|nr:Smr/MutS family protein [Deltaproteobacteria bacterium]
KTGLDEAIIEKAKGFIDQKEIVLESLIAEYQEKNEELKRGIAEAGKEREAHLSEKRNYEDLLIRLRRNADRLVYEARREALNEIRKLREELKNMGDEFREKADRDGIVVRRRRLVKAEEKILGDMKNEEELTEEVKLEKIPAEKIVKGAKVFIKSLSVEGSVAGVVSDDEATVHSGILKMTVRKSDLFYPPQVKTAEAGTSGQRTRAVAVSDFAGSGAEKPEPAGIKNMIDLRGLRFDDAMSELEKTLDQAYMNEEKEILIIHGHGTSSLKKGVRNYLSKSSYAASFRPGTQDEGGDGVTVAVLR